jgi:hypothetical protein
MIEHTAKSNSKNPKYLDAQSTFNVKNPKKLDLFDLNWVSIGFD